MSDSLLTRRDAVAAAALSAAALGAGPAIAQGKGAQGSPGAPAGTQTPTAPQLTGRADPDGPFRGKTLLITGATSGFGRAVAEDAARMGASVFFNGRRVELGR